MQALGRAQSALQQPGHRQGCDGSQMGFTGTSSPGSAAVHTGLLLESSKQAFRPLPRFLLELQGMKGAQHPGGGGAGAALRCSGLPLSLIGSHTRA